MLYWVTFKHSRSGTIEAETPADALEKAKAFGVPHKADTIPYPADPRLSVETKCPSFCYTPQQCKGHTSCPKGYACSE